MTIIRSSSMMSQRVTEIGRHVDESMPQFCRPSSSRSEMIIIWHRRTRCGYDNYLFFLYGEPESDGNWSSCGRIDATILSPLV
jgi:hypothetical protein